VSIPMKVKTPSGYTITITAQPPAPELIPLGTTVTSILPERGRDRGMVIGYNGDERHTFYNNHCYPYVILWENGFFEVYHPGSFQGAA